MRSAVLLLLLACSCVLPNPRDLPEGESTPERSSVARKSRSPGNAGPTAWRTIGTSVEGRPLIVRTVGYGPRRVLWIGGIHGNEREGALATEELPHAFLDRGLEAAATLTILQDANPDGSAASRRENKNGVDLNRNFPAQNFDRTRAKFGETPLSQPEARIVHDLILALDPHLVIVAHSWRGKHFVNFDGPAENLARKFARTSGYPLVRSGDFADTPGSLGSWVGRDLKKSILTIEWLHGKSQETAWHETKEAILQVVAGS